MKKILSAVAALSLGLVLVPNSANATPPADCSGYEGAGSQASPFLVEDQAGLAAVSDCDAAFGGGAFFEQTTDIVLTGDWAPLGVFTGSYDGNYNSISGLNVNDVSSWGAGLFEGISGGTVKELTIMADDLIGQSYAGTLAATTEDVIIESVRVKVTGTMDVIYGAGCLLGSASGSLTITDVYAECTTSSSTRWVGGLVAYAGTADHPVTNLSISKAYSKADLSFSGDGGGLAGILNTTDTSAQVSEFTFAGIVRGPDSEAANVAGIFGWVNTSYEATEAPVISVSNSSVRGTLSSALVTEIPLLLIPPQLQAASFSAAAADYSTTTFRPSPTVGEVYDSGATTPEFVFSNLILAPKYLTPVGSDGYIVNVGLASDRYASAPSCVFHTEPPFAFFSYEQDAGFTAIAPTDIRSAATFDGCLTVVDGLDNYTQDAVWIRDSSVFAGEVLSGHYFHLDIHESTLDYGQESFEITHEEIFSILSSGWNFFPEFTISPALPEGITIEPNTGRILGAASEAFGPTTFTVTRTSVFGYATQTTDITLSQLAAPPAAGAGSYSGPVIELVNPNPVPQGETLTISGERLDQIERVAIGESIVTKSEIIFGENQMSFEVPLDSALGQQPMIVSGSFGSLSFQNGVEITAALAQSASQELRFEVSEMANGDLKLYAFGVIASGKVQFVVDGEEVAWVRAANSSDSKLRSMQQDGQTIHYLVRTIKDGADKKIRFYQNSELIQTHN